MDGITGKVTSTCSGTVVQWEKREEWNCTLHFNNAINLAWKTGNPAMKKGQPSANCKWLSYLFIYFFFLNRSTALS